MKKKFFLPKDFVFGFLTAMPLGNNFGTDALDTVPNRQMHIQ